MAARLGRPPGRRTTGKSLRNIATPGNQNYRLVERICGTQVAFIIQRSPKPGSWYDMEGYDQELVARRRFKTLVEGGGVEERVLDTKVRHSKGAKLLAKAAQAAEPGETKEESTCTSADQPTSPNVVTQLSGTSSTSWDSSAKTTEISSS